MSDETEVTFVGGLPVEQTEGLDSNIEDDAREEAKEAVRKAIQEAGESAVEGAKSGKAKDPFRPEGAVSSKDKEPERGPDGKFLPKDAPKEEPEEEEAVDPDKATVKQLLKAREKVAQAKREASLVKDDVTKQREAFQREQYEFQQILAREKAEIQRERQALASLRKDPARAIRELGLNPEEYILQLAQEGTPEGQAAREKREMQEQIQEMKRWREEQAQAAQRRAYEYQVQQIAHQRNQAVQEFTQLGLQEDKYPHVSTFFKGNEKALVAWGDLAAEEYRALSNGKEGTLADILDYIEDQLAERSNTWYSKKGSSSQVKEVAKPKGSPPKSKGMSLSPEGSGERRALAPKNLGDLDGDERLEAAKQAVAIALAGSKES